MTAFSTAFGRSQTGLTTVGTSFEQPVTYPQGEWIFKSCSYLTAGLEGCLITRLNKRQVLDQKEENKDVHRNVLSLSTTTNLN
jgi:hypothetical protein